MKAQVHSGIHVTRSLVFFVDRCLSIRPFSFGHRVVCPLIYGPLSIFKPSLEPVFPVPKRPLNYLTFKYFGFDCT